VDCICGCGTKLSRDLIDVQIKAGEIGLELMTWDKARLSLDPASADATTVERIIGSGARRYQESLATLHGERPIEPPSATDAWLVESRRERRAIAKDRSFIPKEKIKLTDEDVARFDRRRPELSFSGTRANVPERAGADPVVQLNGLRELHAAGALTDEEFAAAKAGVIARLG
jgi:hypothetical protein